VLFLHVITVIPIAFFLHVTLKIENKLRVACVQLVDYYILIMNVF